VTRQLTSKTDEKLNSRCIQNNIYCNLFFVSIKKFKNQKKNEITITQSQTTCIKTGQNQKPFSLSKFKQKKNHNEKLKNQSYEHLNSHCINNDIYCNVFFMLIKKFKNQKKE
jgi:signal recognition particle GTPase